MWKWVSSRKKYLSNSKYSFKSLIFSTSKETSNVLAKIQKNCNIVIKKVSNSSKNSDCNNEAENCPDPSDYLEQYDFDDTASNPPEAISDEDYNDMIEEDMDNDSDSSYTPQISSKAKKKSVGSSRKTNYVKEIILDGPFAYTCSKCHCSYPSYDDLFNHMKLGPGSCFQEELVCKLCKKSFDTKKKLSSHMSTHKPKGIFMKFLLIIFILMRLILISDSFLCEECSRIFKNQFSLDIHIQSVHRRVEADEAIFACSLCPEKFYSHPDLADHTKEHAREKKVIFSQLARWN